MLYRIVKRADKRRMAEMRVEVGLKKSFKNNILVKSKLTWAGHVERIGDEKWQREQMTRTLEKKKETRKSGTATGDCTKSDLGRVGEEWRKEQQIEGIGDC